MLLLSSPGWGVVEGENTHGLLGMVGGLGVVQMIIILVVRVVLGMRVRLSQLIDE